MHEELVEYEIPSNKSVVNGNLSIEYSPNPHVGDNYNYYIYGPVTYVQPKDEEGKEPTSTPYVLEPSDNGNLHSQTHIDNSSKVCIVDSQKFKIRRFHLLLGACMLVLVATTIGLTAYHLTSSGPSAIDNDDDDNGTLRIVSRGEWFALPPSFIIPKLEVTPAPYVVVLESPPSDCYSVDVCSNYVRFVQVGHIQAGYGDVGFHFFIGGDGSAYSGLGWDLHGAHTLPVNNRSIAVAFFGYFKKKLPTHKQVATFWKLMNMGVEENKIIKNYTIFTHRDIAGSSSPGKAMYNLVQSWPHYTMYDPKKDIPPYVFD